MVLWLAPTMGTRLVRTPQPAAAARARRDCSSVPRRCASVNALRFLPLAEATAINYTTPTLVIVLAVCS